MSGLVHAVRLRASSPHLVVPDALKVNVAVEDVVEFDGAEVIVTDGTCCQCAGAPAAVPDRTSAASPKVHKNARNDNREGERRSRRRRRRLAPMPLTSATTRGPESLNRGNGG